MAEKDFPTSYDENVPLGVASSTQAFFDPLTFCLEVPSGLAVKVDFEHNDFISSPVIFHELVHSWQLYAYTTGFLLGSIRPIQSSFVPMALKKHHDLLIKPLFWKFAQKETETLYELNYERRDDSSFMGALYLVHKYYFDFERLNAVIDDPVSYFENRNSFVLDEARAAIPSPYENLETPLLDLVSLMRMAIKSELKPLRWPGKTNLIGAVKEVSKSSFRASERWREDLLGIGDIQEGHARFMEMQLIACRDREKDDFGFFANNGYLTNRYTSAYRAFLKRSGLTPPSGVLDWRVCVFQVVCEYALNPTAPYLDGYELETLFDEFHPGTRFRTACDALAKIPSLASTEPIDPKYWKFAFEAIEDASRPKWAIPLSEALQTIYAFGKQFFGIDVSLERPLFNLMGRHLNTVGIRAANSSVHLAPLFMIRDGARLGSFLLPPAIKIGSRTNFSKIIGEKRPSWGGYLIGLIFSDLVDQLLRDFGPFKYESSIVPPHLMEAVVEAAKTSFSSFFGVAIEDIPLA